MALRARGLRKEAIDELFAYLRITEGQRREEQWQGQARQAILEMGGRP